MTANQQPIYTRTPDVQWVNAAGLVANTTTDMTAGTTYAAFTADATEGGYVSRLVFTALGGSGNNNVATVCRVWINNGSSAGTAANNTMHKEISLPATTGSATAALQPIEVPLNLQLPAGYKLVLTFGTAVAQGWDVQALGGKY